MLSPQFVDLEEAYLRQAHPPKSDVAGIHKFYLENGCTIGCVLWAANLLFKDNSAIQFKKGSGGPLSPRSGKEGAGDLSRHYK